ncbi:MAG: AAA family ATPase [Myxococcota bacterium]
MNAAKTLNPMNPTAAQASASRHSVQECQTQIRQAMAAVCSVLRGHDTTVERLFTALIARGHVLLEDVPGVGKTTLARCVARVLGHDFARIQFTADMLPADVLGVQVWDAERKSFVFKSGPLFAQLILADEINRASPKTQSAMLEAMAEGAVSIDDQRYELPQPFLVIATQNPVEHHGAYPLPESQLDRFASKP